MINLFYRVEGQNLSEVEGNVKVIRGTKNCLTLNFGFSKEWEGMTVIAVFDGDIPALVINGSCIVPNELTDKPVIGFSVAGKLGDVICTTNRLKIRQGE